MQSEELNKTIQTSDLDKAKGTIKSFRPSLQTGNEDTKPLSLQFKSVHAHKISQATHRNKKKWILLHPTDGKHPLLLTIIQSRIYRKTVTTLTVNFLQLGQAEIKK